MNKIPYPNCKKCGDELTEGEFKRHERIEKVVRRKEPYMCYQCNQEEYKARQERYLGR